MLNGKSLICVIPARLKSTRFPRKMLAPLQDKPLVQWAFESAQKTELFDEVIVAVDSLELLHAVENFGGKAILTSASCRSGTDRLVELCLRKEFEADIWVNWQGDEPFLTRDAIAPLLQGTDREEGEVWTLKKKIKQKSEIASPHVVKVVTDAKGKALYFSRSPIPYEGQQVYKHIGLYAFTSPALQKISKLSFCSLEKEERLEQLRFLFYGMQITVYETDQESFGIDTKEDLAIAEQMCYHLLKT